MKKETYSVYEAKARLSEILRKVRQHKRIIITRRDIPVAEIIPVDATPEPLEIHLDRLEQEGVVFQSNESLDAIAPIISRPGALKRFLDERED